MMMSEGAELGREGFEVGYDADGNLSVTEASEAVEAIAVEGGCTAGVVARRLADEAHRDNP